MRLPSQTFAPALPSMAPLRHPTVTMFMEPADLWRAYEAAAESNSLATDMVTCGCMSTVGDSVAQLTERCSEEASAACQDMTRTARFGAFGFADGAVAHVWFRALDATVGDDGTMQQTLIKMASDALLYTPIWCVWFLTAFVVLERKDVRSIPNVVRNEFNELYRGNLGFFLPLTGIIYGCVPVSSRVLAEELANFVYTTFLSLWNHGRTEIPAVAAGAAEGDER